MTNRIKTIIVAATAALLVAPASWGALNSYAQNFEALNQADPAALAIAGFLYSGLVFDGNTVATPPYGNFKFFYGGLGAPNGGPGFSSIALGEGGVAQGANVINVFSDYNCCQPGQGHFDPTPPTDFVQSNVYREQTIGPADIGTTWSFKFDAKANGVNGCGLTAASDCVAFIRTLDPNSVPAFAQTNFVTFDAQAGLTTNWSTHTISIDLTDPLLNGQVLQFGFQSTSQLFGNTGVFYDNISFGVDTDVDGAPNIADNCRLIANNTGAGAQCDSDGDGFGNRCDGDLNNNGATNAQDTTLFRQQLGQPSVAPTFNKADLNCNGAVNAQDTTLYRGRLGQPAGPGAGP